MSNLGSTPQRIGRCQHCQQIRPVWRWGDSLQAPGGLPTGAWLCARDYSAATEADVHNRHFHIEYDLVVFAEQEPRIRTWANGAEVLTPSQQDLATCRAIEAASEVTT